METKKKKKVLDPGVYVFGGGRRWKSRTTRTDTDGDQGRARRERSGEAASMRPPAVAPCCAPFGDLAWLLEDAVALRRRRRKIPGGWRRAGQPGSLTATVLARPNRPLPHIVERIGQPAPGRCVSRVV